MAAPPKQISEWKRAKFSKMGKHSPYLSPLSWGRENFPTSKRKAVERIGRVQKDLKPLGTRNREFVPFYHRQRSPQGHGSGAGHERLTEPILKVRRS
jgi:hypothetical protein